MLADKVVIGKFVLVHVSFYEYFESLYSIRCELYVNERESQSSVLKLKYFPKVDGNLH